MRYVTQTALVLLLFVLTSSIGQLRAAAPDKEQSKKRAKYGIEKRELWTTSNVQGSPEPPSPYQTEVAFPKLKFSEPLAMATVSGTNRLAIAERKGKIFTFENDQTTDRRDLLIDIGTTIYSLAFHPRFAENGLFFVTRQIDRGKENPSDIQVVQYRTQKHNSLRGDPSTEKLIINWFADGHRGGCLRFGPDGLLYITVGDGSGIADQLKTGQDLSDLLGSILRIDVDQTDGKKNYTIPADNPFIKTKGARPEVFSYGHRQVWKFSFDPPTRRIWAGDVGQDLWEMVYLIQKGGNYGWSVNEGSHPFRPERKKGPTEFVKPIVEHPHSDFRSITGGYVYRGKRLPKLREAYIYGDYDTGKVWALNYTDKVTDHFELVDTQLRIVEFGQNQQGEVFMVDFIGGRLHQLKQASPQREIAKFPKKLSETGLFASTKNHKPAKGLIPYSVNAPLWSDGAVKDRFIALPGDSQIEFESVTYPQPAPGSYPGWRFPHDTVLVKTFSLEMETGNPKSLRRLETRILHHKHMPGSDEVGAQFWRGYTYVWNDEQTDAMLLEAKGLNREFVVKDGDGKRTQKWRFPSRAECTLCHTMSAKYALGVGTLQMNKDHDYHGTVANQLATLNHIGVFKEPLSKSPEKLPHLVDYRDKNADLNQRARSYLHANCAHCHRKWGGGNAEFQLLATLPLDETGTLDVPPGQGRFELKEPRILVAGDANRSLIDFRIRRLGLGRMPHIASNMVDEEAVALISEWIKQIRKKKYDKEAGVAQ